MTTELVTLDFNDGQIIKSGLPNDRRENFLPSVAGFAYNWLRIGGHLGNVCLMPISIRSCAAWLVVCILTVCLSTSASAVERIGAKTDGRGTITTGKVVKDFRQISSRNPDFRYQRPPTPKPGSKSVKLRKALMKQNGRAMKMIIIYLRRNKGTAAQVASNARRLANNLAKLDEQFPNGTSTRDRVGKTRARPKIWAKWPQFRTALRKAKNLAEDLSAAAGAGDKTVLKRAMQALRKNGCVSCHRAFRARRK